jgi:hypothetical protein
MKFQIRISLTAAVVVASFAVVFFGIVSSSIGSIYSQTNDSDTSSGFSSFSFDIPDVSGTFVNNDTGFEITFPSNWTGKQITLLHDMVMVSPEGFDMEALQEPETVMMVNTINEEIYNQISESLNFNAENASSEEDSSVPSGLQSEAGESCDPETASIETVNDLTAEKSIYNCTVDGATFLTQAYAFATSDNSVVLVGFTGSAETFEQYLPEFEESVQTTKISNPADIRESELYSNYKDLIVE